MHAIFKAENNKLSKNEPKTNFVYQVAVTYYASIQFSGWTPISFTFFLFLFFFFVFVKPRQIQTKIQIQIKWVFVHNCVDKFDCIYYMEILFE